MNYKTFFYKGFIAICITSYQASAQHDHHKMEIQKDSIKTDHDTMEMSHSFSRNLPMNRNGSGTGWLPDASVMYGHGVHYKKWMIMFHANVFLRYNHQDITNKGKRGGKKADAPAWFMFMGQRNVGAKGLFHFSTMISLDPFTVGSEGYPLLFQSGETYQNKRLVDRQHPHDLFSEFSVAYTHMFSKNIDVTAYLGYPGEPALGPVAFMHRLSSLNNPDAPLSHHWQDATHISFGVATLGFRFGIFKIEGSAFTGREPDENRYDFDEPTFDSYSYRLSVNPNRQLTLQASQAFLKSPEALDPGENVRRTTASVIHHLPFEKENNYLSTAIVWGYNNAHDHQEHSFLLEPTLQLDKTAVYGRYEWVQKDANELVLPQFINGEAALFNIYAFTVGINRVLLRKAGFNLAAGAQGSIFTSDSKLETIYGRYPVSGEIYIRVSPHLMHMHHH
jgi:hypothetical protein